ncbi:class I SAM-dependent methyltransferase [Fimbriiglobus ruber]|uniref:O-methyltransferase, family 2 n=1 Tax=Fimbriiglobus ruber TaxID=1908690 RepID=A0A225DER5_9BACT|nr:class I SAM-dependent methyltransferase [Fimbriiglobus ruber]OWK34607.1 O-methyltransferase, family 2 [Fimbriiglobus ruber]
MSEPAPGRPNPEKVLQFSFAYAPPLMIEAAVKLKVFDALVAGPKTIEQLASETGASDRGLRILLNGLVGLGLLTSSPTGYALTPEADTFLVSGRPSYLGGFFRHTSTQLIPKWLQLTDIVRTGKPAIAVNAEGQGAAFFEQFVEDIFPLSRPAASGLADHLGLPATTKPVSVLDLAAGSGVWGISLAEKSPHVRVTAVDWPDVLHVTERVAKRQGVADRLTYVAGDLSVADFGTGHHVATLGHILHSEGADRSRALLKKTFAALAPGGTIAIAEWLVDDTRTGPPPGLIFAVNMLVNTDAGDTFSFGEIAKWLTEVGFVNPRVVESLPCPSPLVLATKPG